jgi:hypothetical protein
VGARLKLIPLADTLPEVIMGAVWKGITPSPLAGQFISTLK